MHTATPWRWSGNWLVNANLEHVLYYTINDDGLHGTPEDKAIIAAAPALVAALEGIVNSSDYGSPLAGDDERPLMQAARAALRSAREG